jgi:hypothetical protein
MNLDEVSHALMYTNNGKLDPKNVRDANLIYAFSRNKKTHRASVTELNQTLFERGIDPLKTSKGGN